MTLRPAAVPNQTLCISYMDCIKVSSRNHLQDETIFGDHLETRLKVCHSNDRIARPKKQPYTNSPVQSIEYAVLLNHGENLHARHYS